jgi:hypothetical protein
MPGQSAPFSLVEIRAGKLSLQPEALGVDQEATNGLKHSETVSVAPLVIPGRWFSQ